MEAEGVLCFLKDGSMLISLQLLTCPSIKNRLSVNSCVLPLTFGTSCRSMIGRKHVAWKDSKDTTQDQNKIRLLS